MNEVAGQYPGGTAAIMRVNPIHLGHEELIKLMLQKAAESSAESILFVGSCNAPISMPDFFNYQQRTRFIKILFPELQVIGMPDYRGDNACWFQALDDYLCSAGFIPQEVTFFGGCKEDVRELVADGRKIRIINRFDGTTPKISGTELRDALVENRPLGDLLNPCLHEIVKDEFRLSWQKFRSIRPY